MKVSLNGGKTYMEAAWGVRMIYDGLIGFDGEEVELHINATDEGLIMDIHDLSNNTHMATSSEMAQDIANRIDAEQFAKNKSIEFAHLSDEQNHKIFVEAVNSRVEAASIDSEYLRNMAGDLIKLETIEEQLEIISGDDECVKEILGFDPWKKEE